LGHAVGERFRLGGRLHVIADADEQLVIQKKPQRCEMMAQRWLLHFQAERSLRDTTVPHERVERDQEIEVEGPQIEMVDVSHPPCIPRRGDEIVVKPMSAI
jgi:hypothetical protein